jgi:hypothetical protein
VLRHKRVSERSEEGEFEGSMESREAASDYATDERREQGKRTAPSENRGNIYIWAGRVREEGRKLVGQGSAGGPKVEPKRSRFVHRQAKQW